MLLTNGGAHVGKLILAVDPVNEVVFVHLNGFLPVEFLLEVHDLHSPGSVTCTVAQHSR